VRLIISSNSGASMPSDLRNGLLLPKATGGLVPHVLSMLDSYGGDWFFSSPESAAAAARTGDITLNPIYSERQQARAHYETVSIEILLWLFHYLHDTAVSPAFDHRLRAAWDAYRKVNETFAARLAAACDEASGEGVIIVNDYHQLLVPGAIARGQVPGGTRMIYVHHVPWCEPAYFGILPSAIRTEILESLLCCDTIVFHCRRWKDAFLACCATYLTTQVSDGIIEHAGRMTRITSVPFPLDSSTAMRLTEDQITQEQMQWLAKATGDRQLLVRVDRLDLWKNHVRGFLAYQELLTRHPRLTKDWCFVALATPTRYRSAAHRAYQSRCLAVVDSINSATDGRGSRAVEFLLSDASPRERSRAIAGLASASAVLINPTFDGFNLVAKEAMLVAGPAAILLSTNAGAHEYMASAVEPVEPFDVSGTANALEAVMVTGKKPDIDSVTRTREAVRADTPVKWLTAVLLPE
jgi:trehalose 6-phosphate synthase